jgi:hypothetical protein
MERECFLSILVALLGGTKILACGWWPARDAGGGTARPLERLSGFRFNPQHAQSGVSEERCLEPF